MEGLLKCHAEMLDRAASLPAVIHAVIASFGFVYLHPFEDGNGRIHRFLIHNILFLKGAVPEGLMFPVSAAMLSNKGLYDSALGSFSRPLLSLLKYDLNEIGEMTVYGETCDYYRFPDLTVQAEALLDFMKAAVETEIARELDFLARYDEVERSVQEIVDMPDMKLNLLLNLCIQNEGRLSSAKRQSHFSFLTEDEVKSIEEAIAKRFSDLRHALE